MCLHAWGNYNKLMLEKSDIQMCYLFLHLIICFKKYCCLLTLLTNFVNIMALFCIETFSYYYLVIINIINCCSLSARKILSVLIVLLLWCFLEYFLHSLSVSEQAKGNGKIIF